MDTGCEMWDRGAGNCTVFGAWFTVHGYRSGTSWFVMASLAQMDRELLIERTKEGLMAARKRGRVGGRRRIMIPSKVEAAKKLLAEGMPPKDVAQNLGVSVPTHYRWCPASDMV